MFFVYSNAVLKLLHSFLNFLLTLSAYFSNISWESINPGGERLGYDWAFGLL